MSFISTPELKFMSYWSKNADKDVTFSIWNIYVTKIECFYDSLSLYISEESFSL